jgi:hypothetical protein
LLQFATLCRHLPSLTQNTHHPSPVLKPVSQTLSHLRQSFVTPKSHELSIIESIHH